MGGKLDERARAQVGDGAEFKGTDAIVGEGVEGVGQKSRAESRIYDGAGNGLLAGVPGHKALHTFIAVSTAGDESPRSLEERIEGEAEARLPSAVSGAEESRDRYEGAARRCRGRRWRYPVGEW